MKMNDLDEVQCSMGIALVLAQCCIYDMYELFGGMYARDEYGWEQDDG